MCAGLGLRVCERARPRERESARGCIVARARALKIGSLSRRYLGFSVGLCVRVCSRARVCVYI
jgi:hypothetical protein